MQKRWRAVGDGVIRYSCRKPSAITPHVKRVGGRTASKSSWTGLTRIWPQPPTSGFLGKTSRKRLAGASCACCGMVAPPVQENRFQADFFRRCCRFVCLRLRLDLTGRPAHTAAACPLKVNATDPGHAAVGCRPRRQAGFVCGGTGDDIGAAVLSGSATASGTLSSYLSHGMRPLMSHSRSNIPARRNHESLQ